MTMDFQGQAFDTYAWETGTSIFEASEACIRRSRGEHGNPGH